MKTKPALVIIAILMCLAAAQASQTLLWLDDHAMKFQDGTYARGSTPFEIYNPNTHEAVEGSIQFAVYHAADYIAAGGTGYVTKLNANFIYAYQIFTDRGSNTSLDHFTLNLPPISFFSYAESNSQWGLWNGKSFSSYTLGDNSLTFHFDNGNAINGVDAQYSAVLLFASNGGPGHDRTTLGTGDTTSPPVEGVLGPVQAPEPATMALLGLGLTWIIRKK